MAPNKDNREPLKNRAVNFVGRSERMQISKCIEGIYLSSQETAKDFNRLKQIGITHIVNMAVATGVGSVFPDHFIYHSIDAVDAATEDLRQYFDEALNFIRNAIEKSGKVLVHCNCGVSRSATLVIAYIMKYESKTFSESFMQVQSVRQFICPNEGFVEQLQQFEKELEAQK